jgi:hypothetical protein
MSYGLLILILGSDSDNSAGLFPFSSVIRVGKCEDGEKGER